MAKNVRMYGVLLILVGVAGYTLSSSKSITALIPTFFGLGVLLCTFLGNMPNMQRKATVLVSLIALLGLAGAGSRLPKSFQTWQSGESAYLLVVSCQAIMLLLCFLVFYKSVRLLVQRNNEAS